MFENYRDSLFNNKIIMQSQLRFKSDHHNMYRSNSSNDDKRLQTFDGITTYPYGTNAFKVCESEMLSKNKLSGPDEDKNTAEDKNKNTPKDKDKDKTTPKTMTKTEDKDEDIDMDGNRLIQTF